LVTRGPQRPEFLNRTGSRFYIGVGLPGFFQAAKHAIEVKA
jgi:hypothetical protein